MNKISIIIPIYSDDDSWQTLLPDLDNLPSNIEIIFVTSDNDDFFYRKKQQSKYFNKPNIRLISSTNNKLKQYNTGARVAKGEFLWFLSSNSRFSVDIFPKLLRSLEKYPDYIHYFNIRFLNDGPSLMFINEIFMKLQNVIFKIPVNNHSFCLSKYNFDRIGGFSQSAAYGEEILFSIMAKIKKIKFVNIDSSILISAKKYKSQGWLLLTLTQQFIWIKYYLLFLTKKLSIKYK